MRSLEGLRNLSVGVSPGCAECRCRYDRFLPWEDYEAELPEEGWKEVWKVPAVGDEMYPSEEAAEEAAAEVFDALVRGGFVEDQPDFGEQCEECGLVERYTPKVTVHGLDAEGELIHLEVCADCAAKVEGVDE